MNARSAVVALACACCAACSLFLDTGEFSGEKGAAASDGGDTATPANGDAATSDGTTSTDAGNGDADAGPVPCPDGGFCDSFERTSLVGAWDGPTSNNGCTVSIDGTLGNVGTSSFRTFVPAKPDDACQAFLARAFTSNPKKLRMSFDLRVGSTIDREVQIVGYDVTGADKRLFFSLLQGSLYLAEQQGAPAVYQSTAVRGIEPGAWHHVELTHDIASHDTAVMFDGEPRVTRKTTLPFDASAFTLFIGDAYSRGGADAEIWFDDFRFVAEP